MPDSPLMLSISGLRGIIGSSLTPPVAARYAAAVGSWLRASTGKANPHVVVGCDSRPSGPMIQHSAAAGLAAVGCRVTLLGIATTPGVAVMVEHLHADGGLVITASHNPNIWNGIKTLRHDGLAPPPDQAAQIIDRFKRDDASYVGVDQLQREAADDSAGEVHVARILKHIDAAAIRAAKLKVVLDSVCGAGGPSTVLLLRELGVELVHLNAEPTGLFPHNPEPTAENLTGLCAAVKQHSGAVGFAQDPDADRLALVDETGRYIGEEYTLALGALHLLTRSAARGEKPAPLAANLSTSRMIDDVAARFGSIVYRTPVGEAHVADKMRKCGALFGGEGNGGVIWPKVIHVRDSLSGIALILEMLATTGQKLSQRAAAIPAYAIIKEKLPLQPGMAERAIQKLAAAFADRQIDTQDGIRIDSAQGWVQLRASNTEPILRIIAEAKDTATAARLIAEVRAAIGMG
jgi:phosphomannomutase